MRDRGVAVTAATIPAKVAVLLYGTQAKHESELVPAAIVVDFIDADTFHEQANQKREWGDHAMPKATSKTGRICIRFFVLGI